MWTRDSGWWRSQCRFAGSNKEREMVKAGKAMHMRREGYIRTLFSTHFCYEPSTAINPVYLNIHIHIPENNWKASYPGYTKIIFDQTIEIIVNAHASVRNMTGRSHVSSTQFPPRSHLGKPGHWCCYDKFTEPFSITKISHRRWHTKTFARSLELMNIFLRCWVTFYRSHSHSHHLLDPGNYSSAISRMLNWWNHKSATIWDTFYFLSSLEIYPSFLCIHYQLLLSIPWDEEYLMGWEVSYGMRCIPGCEEYPRCEKYPMRYGVFWNMRIIPWDKDYSMVGGLFHSMSILGEEEYFPVWLHQCLFSYSPAEAV